MDNSKGGYVIIDISKLALAETESATAITEASVLKQLLGLSIYGLRPDLKLKPIYLRALDENGKEVVVLCELERDSSGLVIRAEILGHSLEIIVTYDVDSDTQEIIIDSVTYEYVAVSESVKSAIASVEDGTIAKVLGIDADGEIVKGVVSGGVKLYQHDIKLTDTSSNEYHIILVATSSDANTSYGGGPAYFDKTKFSELIGMFSKNNQELVLPGLVNTDNLSFRLFKVVSGSQPSQISTSFVSDTVIEL